MLSTFADIEARKAEKLKQSQEQFEKSFQLAPIRGRREGLTITAANEAFKAMFG